MGKLFRVICKAAKAIYAYANMAVNAAFAMLPFPCRVVGAVVGTATLFIIVMECGGRIVRGLKDMFSGEGGIGEWLASIPVTLGFAATYVWRGAHVVAAL